MKRVSVLKLVVLVLLVSSCSTEEIYIIPGFTDQSSTNPGIDIFLTEHLARTIVFIQNLALS